MLGLHTGRVDNPVGIVPRDVAKACRERDQIVVQFSESDAYSPATLASVNEACRLAGDRLQIRFYGHYRTAFDAAVLKHLPDVQNLAVDCLTAISHEDEIGRLAHLKRLVFGVFELNRPDFLNVLDLSQLERLILIANRKKNLDLTPLGQCSALKELSIHGDSKGIESIARLPVLRKLVLGSYAKAHGLAFVSSLPALRHVVLILGGRNNVDDMWSSSVEILEIDRVRGLSDLGDLARFSSLEALRVEDQLQLVELDVAGANLKRLCVANCKNLTRIMGLEDQAQLREFRASRVALDMEILRDRDWGPQARSVRLFSGSQRWNDEASARLGQRGLGEEGEPWL